MLLLMAPSCICLPLLTLDLVEGVVGAAAVMLTITEADWLV